MAMCFSSNVSTSYFQTQPNDQCRHAERSTRSVASNANTVAHYGKSPFAPLIVEGVPVQVRRDDGTITGDYVRLIDFDNADANDWLAVNQYTVIENKAAARARMRVLVKRLLRKYGYPPDLQDAAVQKVLQQAEALSAEWAA